MIRKPGRPYRLESGGCIDRSKAIRFRFNGEELTGFQGDTLASALLANGVRVVGTQFQVPPPARNFHGR